MAWIWGRGDEMGQKALYTLAPQSPARWLCPTFTLPREPGPPGGTPPGPHRSLPASPAGVRPADFGRAHLPR